jgi:hypothetical protein
MQSRVLKAAHVQLENILAEYRVLKASNAMFESILG